MLECAIPTPYDELSFAEAVYHDTRIREDIFISRGFRLYQDVSNLQNGLRVIMYVPSWFPTQSSRHSFPSEQLPDDVVIGFVFRGTVCDEISNIKADIQLIWNKLAGNGFPCATGSGVAIVSNLLENFKQCLSSMHVRSKPRLHVHVCGHSLGAHFAEATTVILDESMRQEGISWKATTFESPGLPNELFRQALQAHPQSYWEDRITGYLAAPNPINTLHRHLGRIMHVALPLSLTVSHVLRCISADVGRFAVLVPAVMWLTSAISGLAPAAAASSTAIPSAAAISARSGLSVVPVAAATVARSSHASNTFTTLSRATQMFMNVTPSGVPLLSTATVAAFAVTGASAHMQHHGHSTACLGHAMILCSQVLGLEASELIDQHKLSSFFCAFDRDTGQLRPECAVPMQSWPCLDDGLGGSTLTSLVSVARCMIPSVIYPSNLGLRSILDRRAMIERRVRDACGNNAVIAVAPCQAENLAEAVAIVEGKRNPGRPPWWTVLLWLEQRVKRRWRQSPIVEAQEVTQEDPPSTEDTPVTASSSCLIMEPSDPVTGDQIVSSSQGAIGTHTNDWRRIAFSACVSTVSSAVSAGRQVVLHVVTQPPELRFSLGRQTKPEAARVTELDLTGLGVADASSNVNGAEASMEEISEERMGHTQTPEQRGQQASTSGSNITRASVQSVSGAGASDTPEQISTSQCEIQVAGEGARQPLSNSTPSALGSSWIASRLGSVVPVAQKRDIADISKQDNAMPINAAAASPVRFKRRFGNVNFSVSQYFNRTTTS